MGYLDTSGLAHLWDKVTGYVDKKLGESGGSSGGIPAGCILIWSGAAGNIPQGWQLCDGTNGTPDLQDRFVLGAGARHAPGESGGVEEVALTVEQMPDHTHTYDAPSTNTVKLLSGLTGTSVINSTASSSTSSAGSSQPHPNMPPYYALAYIIKL